MANKRKITTAVVASAAAAVVLLGGTFAWYSISQTALNEKAGVVNVGGRLHDDFNGTNKDVYVENFTDPLNGGQPIYARIRLDEYMEVGPEAGLTDEFGNFVANRNAQSVVNGAKIDDDSTWSVHTPETDCVKCTNGDTCAIHDHWAWEMGGSTVFMPTFNKDKDSLEADINGTYDGKNPDDTIHYDDYVVYVDDASKVVNNEVYQKTADAYYDDDENDAENDHANQIGVTVQQETHYGKQTVEAVAVITMDEWKNTYNSQPGDYWVYDTTDGWAYWANPIMPGEATGLLLDSIKMTKNPGEKCYYAINVIGQFATVGDWDQFDLEGDTLPSADAMDLLDKASKNVPVVTVSQADNITFVTPGGPTYDFSATVAINGINVVADTDFEWSVYDENLKVIDPTSGGSSIDTNGVLTVVAGETNKTLTVVARSLTHGGAVGAYSVGVRQNVVTTDTIENSSAYVLLTENGTVPELGSDGNPTGNNLTAYKMSFIRSETEPSTVAHLYENKDIVAVYSDVEKTTYVLNDDSTSSNAPWEPLRAQINDVEIVNNLAPTSTALWFWRMSNVTEITDLEKVDVTNVTNMHATFNNTGLTSLDLSSWAGKTGNVEIMRGMFFRSNDLTEIIGLGDLDVSGVTDMGNMFRDCTSLTTLDLSTWATQTGKVTNMEYLFSNCTGLTDLNISGWDTSKVENMYQMFYNCSSLTDTGFVGVGGWDVSSVESMYQMFYNCTTLTTLDLSTWAGKTGNVKNMQSMFSGCTGLGSITGLGGWDVSSVESMYQMFYNCTTLTTLDLSTWAGKTGNVTDMRRLFYGCTSLQNINVSGWDTSKVTVMQDMFMNCTNLNTITGIGDFDLRNVTNMRSMFQACSGLTTLDLSDWQTDNVISMFGMFLGCNNLTSITGIENWNVSNATELNQMFQGCSALTANCSGWTVNQSVTYDNFVNGATGVQEPTWPTATVAE